MQSDLIDLEKKFWTNDQEFYEANYTVDAVLIFPGVGKLDRASAIAAIRDENRRGHRWAEVALDDVATVELTAEVVLLTYSARARWNYQETASTVVCSTVYVLNDGQWRVALYQQTDG
jgi:Domain of unknown function (DUF4440)